jgi:hypothetical protein
VETGEDTIMVVVDHGLMKGVILIPTQEKGLIAERTARPFFIKHVFKQFGIPDKLISDRGVQFDSEFFQEFCKHLAYNPQCPQPITLKLMELQSSSIKTLPIHILHLKSAQLVSHLTNTRIHT